MRAMPRPVSNPPNPWNSTHVEWIGEPPDAQIEIFEEEARSIVSENDSPDIPFRFSVNPYRGCLHACAYCYARPTHQYLGYGAGTDFDRKIVVKVNAPELLEQELCSKRLRGQSIVFSGVTDPYQPIEASYRITRRCLEAIQKSDVAVGVITKSCLIRRDIDLLSALAREGRATVYTSLAFADAETARLIEPSTPSPALRIETLRALAAAGIPTGLALAPVIPGLNDHEIPRLLRMAREAGATRAFMTLLRLPAEVLPVFEERLQAAFPLRAAKIFNRLRQMRGGKVHDPRFGRRMEGSGEWWETVSKLFEIERRALGYNSVDEEECSAGKSPRYPTPPAPVARQTTLFEIEGFSRQNRSSLKSS